MEAAKTEAFEAMKRRWIKAAAGGSSSDSDNEDYEDSSTSGSEDDSDESQIAPTSDELNELRTQQESILDSFKRKWQERAGKGVLEDDLGSIKKQAQRVVLIDRGPVLKPLGLDVLVKEEDGGTLAEVKGVKRGSLSANAQLKSGDVFVKVNNVPVQEINPNNFFTMFNKQNLELIVYNKPDLKRKIKQAEEALQAQKEAMAQANKLKEERNEFIRERKNKEKAAGRRWHEYFNNSDKWHTSMSEHEKDIQPESEDWKRLIRFVYLDRRKGKEKVVEATPPETLHDSPDKDTLEDFGLRVLVRDDIGGGGEGTFAMIKSIKPEGLAANAGGGNHVFRTADRILKLQGVELSHLTTQQTYNLLESSRLEFILQDEFYTRPKAENKPRIELDRVVASVNEKAKYWFQASRMVLSEFGAAVRTLVGHDDDKQKSSSADGVDDNPQLPDMFHFYAPCPVVRGSSGILNGKAWCHLWADLPDAAQFLEASMLFATQEDGYSLRSMIHATKDVAPMLFLVRTEDNNCFGAYIDEPIMTSNTAFPPTKKYWGGIETFVFSLQSNYKSYKWVGIQKKDDKEKRFPEYFITATNDYIAIGGGGPTGHALVLDDDLHHGSSDYTHIFENLPLHRNDDKTTGYDNNFKCVALEIWKFSADDVNL
eukprot:m.56953 g.56953  ORF g.56953 m.56953 type:complete len:653 (+) comp11069_c0_seq1:815-2773(+)